MAHKIEKITIFDHDYHSTEYTVIVMGDSANQRLVLAAFMAGQKKNEIERERTGNDPGIMDLSLPYYKAEPATLDEFYDHQYTVAVKTH